MEIFDNTLMTLALGGLAVSLALFASAWLYPHLRRAWDKATALARAVFCGAVAVACLYGGAKHKTGGISYPKTDNEIAYLTDAGSYVTNDAVHVAFTRLPMVPSSATFYLDYCALDGTNAQGVATNWVNAKTATFGELTVPFDFAFANATNYNWLAYTDWTPGPAVQTNGVWHAYWGLDRKQGRYFIPVRTCVRDGSSVIATPKSKGPAALLGYASRGLVCFYDESDPDGETCDTSFLLKAEGNSSYEEVYTCEFCVTKLTNSEWVNVTWNNGSYPFLARPTYQTYLPNAYQTGARGEEVRGLYFTTNLVLTVSAVPDGNGKRSFYWLGKYAASCSQNMSATLAKAIYPKKLNIHNSTDIVIHSYRLYNRALTAEEVAHNYEIDKARFGSGNE